MPEVEGEEGDKCEPASWQRRRETCGQGQNSGKSPNTFVFPLSGRSVYSRHVQCYRSSALDESSV